MRQKSNSSSKIQLFSRAPFLLLSIGFVLFILVVSSQSISASGSDLIIYAANRNAEIFEVNLSLGTSQQVGTLAFGTQAIDQDPDTGYVYYFEESSTSPGDQLAYWDPATNTNTIVKTYNPAPGIDAKQMAFHPNGRIFLVDEDEWVYRIEKDTGDITTLGPVSGAYTGWPTLTGDIAISPAGIPYMVSYRNLFTVNNSLQATEQYSNMLTGSAFNLYWTGLAYCEGMLYASHYESDQAETYGLSSMYSIDPGTGAVNELFALPSDVSDLTSCSTVASSNNRPVGNDNAVNTDENTAVSITLTGSDIDGDPLTYNLVDFPANGSLSGSAPNLTYTPNTDFVGNDSFTFQADDGIYKSYLAFVTVSVAAVNNIPVADNQSVNMDENTSFAITLTGSDADGDALTYSVVGSPAHGILSGSAPNVTYTPNTDYVGSDSFTFKVNDGAVDSNVATVSIIVANVNTAPVANSQSLNSDEDTPAAITLTGSDADGDALTYSLVMSPTNGNLSGSLPNVTYIPNAGYTGADSFTFKVNDGAVDSNVATVSIMVVEVNTAPVANNQSLGTDENTAVSITLTASDADGDPLTYSVVGSPANGSLSGTAPNLTYTPNADYVGLDSLTFKVNDGTVDSNVATVDINVAGVNTAPVANNQSVSTDENIAVAITLTGSDADGDALTYSVVGTPANGSLSGTAPNLIYTPNTNYVGADSFTFKVNDGTLDSSLATITVTVADVNAAPVANNQSVSTDENTSLPITLTGSDADGDALTYSVVVAPANGSLSGTAPNLTYTPNTDYTGSDSFTFKVNDGAVDSNIATVSITVVNVNVPPVANNQSVNVNENSAVAISLTGSDADGDALTYSVVNSPANGSLSGAAPNLTYTPNTNYVGPDSFTFSVNDGAADSNVATVSITVVDVNAAPVANNQSVSTDVNTAVSITLTASDTDGDTLTYSVVDSPTNGSLSGTAPNLTYTPDTDYVGADGLTFKVNDGTVDSNVATISITVNGQDVIIYGGNRDEAAVIEINLTQNTAQQVGTLAFGTVATEQDQETGYIYYFEKFLTGDEFAYWDPATGTNTIVRTYNPAPGIFIKRMAFHPNGTLYVMDNTDTLHTIDKNNGDITTVGQVTGLVTGPLNGTGDMAFAPDGTHYIVTYGNLYTVDSSLQATLLYADMLPLSNDIVTWTGLAICDGTLYASHIEADAAQTNGYSAMYTIDLGTGAINQLFALPTYVNDLTTCPSPIPWNHAPVADDQAVNTNEDMPVAITLTGSDADGDALTFSQVISPSNGVLSGTMPNVTYAPNPGFVGADSLTFKVNDGAVDSNVATVSITVAAVNTAPTAQDQTVYTDEDTAVSITLTGTDADGDPLTYNVVGSPANGSLSGTAPNLTYTPNAGFSGLDSFTFEVDDGTAVSNLATVSIFVTGQNDTIIYASNRNAEMFEVNLTLNTSHQVGTLAFGTQAMEQDPVSGYVYYFEEKTIGNGDQFAYWDPTTNTSTIVRTYNPIPDFYAKRLSFHPDGTLYLMDDDEQVYTIDKQTGDIAFVSQVTGINTGWITGTGDNAFAPDGTFYIATYRNLYTVDNSWQATELYSNMLVGSAYRLVWTGLAYCDGMLYGSHFEGDEALTYGLSNMYSVDPGTGVVTELFGLPTYVNDLTSCAVPPPTNTAPVANNQSVNTDENTSVAITLTGSDVDGDSLTYSVVNSPANGSLSGTAPNLTYTPNTDYVGADSFTFNVNDGAVDSNVATISITVNNVNTAPVADNQAVSTEVNTSVAIILTGSDADGDALTYTLLSSPSSGNLIGTAPNLTYTPNSNFTGADSFTFKVNDGAVDSNTATISINVAGGNTAPVANNQAVNTDEDTSVAITLTGSDADGDPLAYHAGVCSQQVRIMPLGDSITVGASSGVYDSDKMLSYRKVLWDSLIGAGYNVDFVGSQMNGHYYANFDYEHEGHSGWRDDQIAYHIYNNGGANWLNNTPADIILLHIGTNEVNTNPADVENILNEIDQYEADNNTTVTVILARIINRHFYDSTTTQFNNNVEAMAQARIAAGDQIVMVDMEDGASFNYAYQPTGDMWDNLHPYATGYTKMANVWMGALQNVLTLSCAGLTPPSNGTLSGTAPNLTYTPNAGFTGSDSFTFYVDDGTADSNVATVSITVNPVNDPPIADDQLVSTDENTAVAITLTGSDPDGDALTYNVVGTPLNGSLTGSAPNLTYTPDTNFIGGDSLTFQVDDGTAVSNSATVSITVNAVNSLILYGSNDNGDLVEINVTQNSAQVVSTLAFGTYAIEQDASTGYVYYFEQSAAGDQFAYWDPATGTNTIVRTYNPSPGISVKSMAFHPNGNLFILDDDDWVHRMDKTSGDITTLGPVNGLVTGSIDRPSDIAFAPDYTPYLVTYRNLYQVSNTLQPTLLYENMLPVNNDIVTWTGLAYCDGILYASHLESNAAQTSEISKMYSINPDTGAVTELFTLPTHVNDLTSCSPN